MPVCLADILHVYCCGGGNEAECGMKAGFEGALEPSEQTKFTAFHCFLRPLRCEYPAPHLPPHATEACVIFTAQDTASPPARAQLGGPSHSFRRRTRDLCEGTHSLHTQARSLPAFAPPFRTARLLPRHPCAHTMSGKGEDARPGGGRRGTWEKLPLAWMTNRRLRTLPRVQQQQSASTPTTTPSPETSRTIARTARMRT